MTDSIAIFIQWNDPATGDEQTQWLPLPATFGRSRQHAQINLTEQGLVVEDLGSTNGTYLNGKPIERAKLNLHDSIHISPFTLTVSRLATTAEIEHEIETQHPLPMLKDESQTRRLSVQEIIGLLNQNNHVWTDADYLEVSPEGLAHLLSDTTLSSVSTKAFPIPQDQEATQQMLEIEMDEILSEAKTSDLPALNLVFIAIDTDSPSLALPAFWQKRVVKVAEIRQSGFKVEETTYLSVGGGIGSFIWIDNLQIFGVPASQIVSIGFEPHPYGRYRRLCRNSQIPDHERLRSDSGSTPDNIWGYPGYAVREILSDLGRGRILHAGKVLWQIFGEPTFAETYTPISGRVFDSIDREAKRIAWDSMWRQGRVLSLRKTDDGRYAILYTVPKGHTEVEHILLAREVHLAVGYPGFRLLDDLTRYREETGDFRRVVNAYEDHDHIYGELAQHGGVVMIRGRGIVASRIIQRIYELRQANPHQDIKIINLMRSPLPVGHRFGNLQRVVDHHWELQAFNWPKAAWGGAYKDLLFAATDSERDSLLNDWGGTTTADRHDWRRMIQEGMNEGWYTIVFGNVSEVTCGKNGEIMTQIRGKSAQKVQSNFISDYVIDCTGLNASLESNPFLFDLLQTYRLPRNVKGRLKVDDSFQIPELRNKKGHVIATGAMTFGNGYAPVDSFLGLQFTASAGIRRLRQDRAPHLKRMSPLRSLWQWGKWVAGLAPN